MIERRLLLAGLGAGLLARPALAQRDTSRWLIEMPATKKTPRPDVFGLILSGDGGWRDIDRTLGRNFRNRGMSVVGFDCLNWFWTRRTPQEVAAELDRVIALYAQKWNIPKVAIIGYSFGADILPGTWPRLKQETRDRVALVSLLGFAKEAAFEIRVGDFLGMGRPTAVPTLPDVPNLPPELVQCVYGTDEAAGTGCTAFASPPAEIIGIKGGHHFDGDYRALADRIYARLPPPPA
ncbi:AcvB/VirJ family lysyl-phosphatidylglycerol hydrolase [Pseudoroseomonas ludipueritiae]|uniref:Type IV secretion system protein VirJ n=1 Tax=Pseudoroseomonas ludipueritiae TaxID=198093 RepID=A0ABR7R9Z3_9PROT|nr:AcvB/VirJ family lysyl-phosphatidylglycerol hydrolase [Pseudoroseomonas ludipueritiae]MBC9178644.1 type IV secretion system protein VirJ [Pseudoroseomonas ludipueritiae]MCG7362102.1 virulence factor [Roseomonas sp. ACRSG]